MFGMSKAQWLRCGAVGLWIGCTGPVAVVGAVVTVGSLVLEAKEIVDEDKRG